MCIKDISVEILCEALLLFPVISLKSSFSKKENIQAELKSPVSISATMAIYRFVIVTEKQPRAAPSQEPLYKRGPAISVAKWLRIG